jgi:MFS family permease
VVAACFVIAAFAWGLCLFGASVYLQAVTAHYGWAVAQVSSAITLFFVVSALAQGAVGRAIDRFGPRPVLSAGVLVMSAGVAAIGQVAVPWHLYPCFVLVGLGWSALSTTGISATVAPWFERHQGRSITVAMMGASVGAIAGVPLLLAALARLGPGPGLALVALVTMAVLLPLIGRLLRHRGPAALGQQRDGDASPTPGAPIPVATPLASRGRPAVLLWSAAAGFAVALTVQIGFITHHVMLATPILGGSGAGMLVSATGAMAFLGRLVLARIVDRLDVRRLTAAILVAQAGALLAMSYRPAVEVLIAASLAYGYGIGHVTTLAPVVVRREFGALAFGKTYGTAATFIQLVAATGPFLFGIMHDRFGGYAPGLAVAAGAALVAAAVLLGGGHAGRPVRGAGRQPGRD